MLKGQSIVCFAKDWEEDPTSNNHVMRMLAKHNRVLWLNSLGMRKPNISSGRDLRKIWNKMKYFTRGPKQVEKGLWVFTPLVMPFPHSRIAIMVNIWILRITLAFLRNRLDMHKFQLWTFLPNTNDYVGKLGESNAVYYCIDEWSHFSYLDGNKMAEMEEQLCKKSDIVFVTAHSLFERKRQFNPQTYLALHGVDYAHFSKTLSEDTKIDPELVHLSRPVLGFFGLIHEWIDLDLIAYLANHRPDWNIVMIGKVQVDVTCLSKYPNVYFLGRRPYRDLPKYCRGFSVGLIPFKVNDLTVHVNPIKLREYLSAGLPVVSTNLPEVQYYNKYCFVARSYDDFLKGVEVAIKNNSEKAAQERSSAMKGENWEQKVMDLSAHVEKVIGR
jgi:glycosyltransferase involved in cell wall biosynthesis